MWINFLLSIYNLIDFIDGYNYLRIIIFKKKKKKKKIYIKKFKL